VVFFAFSMSFDYFEINLISSFLRTSFWPRVASLCDAYIIIVDWFPFDLWDTCEIYGITTLR